MNEWAQQFVTDVIAHALGGSTWRLVELTNSDTQSDITFRLNYPIVAPDGRKYERVDLSIVVHQSDSEG